MVNLVHLSTNVILRSCSLCNGRSGSASTKVGVLYWASCYNIATALVDADRSRTSLSTFLECGCDQPDHKMLVWVLWFAASVANVDRF
ncbi:hypothetical protein MRB53_020312 [Persea americana]|uniref:Uncharacterized protein n=1 Tax=Persea americana TaxID=3435 RepID=A0ACC2L149_PERAE|nr:hypothetical protein MRB53_020312 [Persea americana]